MPGPFTAELTERAIISPGVADLSFAMRSPDRLLFKAGQFVSIGVPSAGGSAESAFPRRSYSIASQSDAGDVLRLIIRAIPECAASEYLMSLPLRTRVSMTGPHGLFVLDASHPGDIVLGATGTGIAAIMPMLGELARRQEKRRTTVFWGARREEGFFARDEIEALAASTDADLRLYATAPGPGWRGGCGRITPAILDTLPRLDAPTFYLVGNGAMVMEVKGELVARGVNRKTQIRTEAFFD